MWTARTPIRFLIAETETGYTLLAALWLAKRFGCDAAIELSPLFETAEALDRGERVLEEALRSPHYRDYLRAARPHLPAIRLFRFAAAMSASSPPATWRNGSSCGWSTCCAGTSWTASRWCCSTPMARASAAAGIPDSLADRMAYLSPPQARAALDRAGLKLREEMAFQGGDGYLLFGTPQLAAATVAGIAAHAFAPVGPVDDPVYAEADYVADFFATVRREMQALVADPGYAALLGAFGPGLLDRTGSRPAVRQSDGMGGPMRISHPSQLRAIPNNAILQQLGWMANSLHGLGIAAEANPDAFQDLIARSPRFKRALAMAARASACSDIGVLRAVVDTLDPGPWLDRAGFTRRPGRREALLGVAAAVDRLDLDAPTRRLFRRLQADHLALRAAWPGLPAMPDRLVLLHALRLALIHRIWLLAVELPDFSPRHGATRETHGAAHPATGCGAACSRCWRRSSPPPPVPWSGSTSTSRRRPREGLSYAPRACRDLPAHGPAVRRWCAAAARRSRMRWAPSGSLAPGLLPRARRTPQSPPGGVSSRHAEGATGRAAPHRGKGPVCRRCCSRPMRCGT